ncbi:enoyl-CoA hydratase/isomerase family protein [Streptomyces canus]|uniref:enoyl-CoA hydratase/isomerase family protein n=1 Tax=Streptomyces canus TaxID=58343 RepID=UPI00368A0189
MPAHGSMSSSRSRNALNAPLADALTAALTEAERDTSTSAVLVTGSGPSFCAGADLQHLPALAEAGAPPVPFLRTVSDLTRRLERSAHPVVAVLHGQAVASGLEIALACDAVVTEPGTLIGDGHIRNHLVPGAGSAVRMRRKLGDSLGRWLALSGELLPAERFLDTRWLHEVVEPGQGADARSARRRDLRRGRESREDRFEASPRCRCATPATPWTSPKPPPPLLTRRRLRHQRRP